MAQKSKTYYTDKVKEQKSMLINCIKRNVKKFGAPYISVIKGSSASIEVDFGKYVFCLKTDYFTDQICVDYDYEELTTDELAILADYSNNI